jgi:hypothetical protein
VTLTLPTLIEMAGIAFLTVLGLLGGFLAVTLLVLFTFDSGPNWLGYLNWPIVLVGGALGCWWGVSML